jgi:flagellar protein FliS
MAIVTELSLSLNQEAGGELSKNLSELYGYVELLLMKANSEQSDPPLAEAERLIGTLAEAWEICAQSNPANTTFPEQLESRHEPLSCAY